MNRLFTVRQQELLERFLQSGNSTPIQLFNGVENQASLSPQMRILLSSHILTVGRFDPQQITGVAPFEEQESTENTQEEGESTSADMEIGANSCRHWAMMVYAYAGLGVPGEGRDGQWHTHDPTGSIVLGAASPQASRGGYGSTRGMRRNHTDRYAPFFGPGIQAENIFNPGDWLQFTTSATGGHSVVLNQVLSDARHTYTISYYSQNINDRGRRVSSRREEQKRMWKIFSGNEAVDNRRRIVFGHTPMSQTQDASSDEDFLPGLHSENQNGLTSQRPNRTFIQLRLNITDEIVEGGAELSWLCPEVERLNQIRIDNLVSRQRITTIQAAQLQRLNRSSEATFPDLERLVRLNRRLANIMRNDNSILQNANRNADEAGDRYRPGQRAGFNGLRGNMSTEADNLSGLLRQMPDKRSLSWSACPSYQPSRRRRR